MQNYENLGIILHLYGIFLKIYVYLFHPAYLFEVTNIHLIVVIMLTDSIHFFECSYYFI